MRNRKFMRSFGVLLLAFILSCSGILYPDTGILRTQTEEVRAAAAKINKTKKTIYVGSSYKLKIKNASKKYTWTSSDPSVAKVKTKKGKSTKIVGVSAGKATITATLGDKTFKCKITVKNQAAAATPTPKPTAVPTPTPIPVYDLTTDNKSVYTLPVGGQLKLKLVGRDASKYYVDDSKKSYLDVTKDGLVTALKVSSDPVAVKVEDKFYNHYFCKINIVEGSSVPTPKPTAAPTPKPTAAPKPTAMPTATPTPTAKPTAAPTPVPGKAYLDPASVELTPGQTYQIKLVGTDIMHCMPSGWDDDYADVTTTGMITAKKAGFNLIVNVYGTDMNMYEFRLTIGAASVKELTDSEIDKLLAKDTYGILYKHNRTTGYESSVTYTVTDEKSLILACRDGFEKGAETFYFRFPDDHMHDSMYWCNTLAQDLKVRPELDGYYSYTDVSPATANGVTRISLSDTVLKTGWKAVLALKYTDYSPDDETKKLLRDAYRLADKAAKLYPDNERAMLLYINNYFCDLITYSDPFPPAGDVPQRDATGAFYMGDAVCEGYASSLRLVLNILGYENTALCNKRGSHVWNYVKVDGTWYHIDVTWNDIKDSFGYYYNTYFMLTDSEMKKVNASSKDTGLHDWYTPYPD